MKPEEEQEFRIKDAGHRSGRTANARRTIGVREQENTPAGHASPRSKPALQESLCSPISKMRSFEVFDLSNTNEPELILTAKARMPQHAQEKTRSSDVKYMITLVAREDVNGDFHKALVNITDTQHLDAIPRLELD